MNGLPRISKIRLEMNPKFFYTIKFDRVMAKLNNRVLLLLLQVFSSFYSSDLKDVGEECQRK
jgi:hypothetical protein